MNVDNENMVQPGRSCSLSLRRRSVSAHDVGPPSPSPPDAAGLLHSHFIRYGHFRNRLYELFGAIEKEFESLYAENLALHVKVEALTERLTEGGALPPEKAAEILNLDVAASVAASSGKGKKGGSQVGQRLKTALRVPPGRLVQTFKVGNDASRTRFVRIYDGHRDGVWHVHAAAGTQWLASASADSTARLWNMHTGQCVAQYVGHGPGCSVNSVQFRPCHNETADAPFYTLVTASGDQSAHIWRVSLSGVNVTAPGASQVVGVSSAGGNGVAPATGVTQQTHSSEDELEPPATDREDATADDEQQVVTVRNAIMKLTGHTGVVIAADWLCSGDQIITASWDRTANIYDAEKGEILNILSGHDQELTHCHAHPSQKLVVTSSKDSTFRLWDFRDPIHSVAVFQGHADVNSAILCATEKVVSSSEDRCVKVWDLKNMRAPLATLRLDSPANRVAVSRSGVIAIPHDNRHVRLYDMSGVRLARLPRANRRCHRRMVTACVWADDSSTGQSQAANLFTCGFDKAIIGWQITIQSSTKE